MEELDGRVYNCRSCGTRLALADDIFSKAFYARSGKAYLFNSVSNISVGEPEERMMLTGMHTVSDICCCSCGQNVGWKYEAAQRNSQKYKVGKFILERAKIENGSDSPVQIDTESNGRDVDNN